jgi:hypothetical protein
MDGPMSGPQMDGPMRPGNMDDAPQIPMQQDVMFQPDSDAPSPSLPMIAFVHAMMARAQAQSQPRIEIAAPNMP